MSQFSQGLVCFLDILGFRSMVANDIAKGESANLQTLQELMAEVAPSAFRAGVFARQFSDSIILSAPFQKERLLSFLDYVTSFQRRCVCRSVLIRGGIGIGHHYASETLLFSEGLIRAYEIESTTSRYPRVVVDEELLLLARHLDNSLETGLTQRLMVDFDGAPFLDYLAGGNLDEHERSVKQILQGRALVSPSVLEKHRWLAEYHNHKLCERGDPAVDFGLRRMARWPGP